MGERVNHEKVRQQAKVNNKEDGDSIAEDVPKKQKKTLSKQGRVREP